MLGRRGRHRGSAGEEREGKGVLERRGGTNGLVLYLHLPGTDL